ncbi:MAG TPA: D-alanyl-D-alanine carboxypeptidase family protein [Candidatus Saccharimonadales bacterium]|nr:D-alanyl-D-alanine carboxypeptidase family protein [Candidatus Saccharimonadales bacterium]
MRYWLPYSITVFCLVAGVGLLLWFFGIIPQFQVQASQERIASPLPSFLDMTRNNQVTTLTYWLPTNIPSDNGSAITNISAKSALAYDISTEKFLYIKNINQHVPMASLTKIMTATIALEHPKPDDEYVVHGRDLVGEDSMGLEPGEKLSLEELLYGIFLHSGNDAAEVLADNVGDGRNEFIANMNDKIKTLGLNDTHFTNPTGLEGDGDQYTTAYDLLVITRYGLTNFPLFAKTSSAVNISIPQTATHKAYYMDNETNLLTSYPGVDGVKTGYTPEAGYCLVTDLKYGGHHIIAVILGSDNRRDEMKRILDYSLTSLGTPPPHHE